MVGSSSPPESRGISGNSCSRGVLVPEGSGSQRPLMLSACGSPRSSIETPRYGELMAIRKIATLGHPVLREVARKITLEELRSKDTQRFLDDLVETMHDANGAGLAANQVYEPVRICAIEVRKNPRYPYKPDYPLTILVNPELTPTTE